VIKQISERLAILGHQVTVATTYQPGRKSKAINGVRIEEFNVSGNAVRGFTGETERYQDFLKKGDFDVVMNYAAQQWTADLMFPILDQIPYKKVLVPCGFSELYNSDYAIYFAAMPEILKKYNHLVFHAGNYRDVNFAHHHGIENESWSLIPNGASRIEFLSVDPNFRARYGIPSDAIMLLTVGSHTGLKGHRLIFDVFEKLSLDKIFLVVIGNALPPQPVKDRVKLFEEIMYAYFWRLLRIAQRWRGSALLPALRDFFEDVSFQPSSPGCSTECRIKASHINHSHHGRMRHVLLLDPPRSDVVAAYHAADLFVFGSNVEYSPLVLFEAMASKIPFLSLACGNAVEIAAWSKGGKIVPTIQIKEGMVDGDPEVFAKEIVALLENPAEMKSLAENGYTAWQERFTWEKIALQYEDLYRRLIEEK
jgi:glycosyltransferase involved in cell wall biosynthesis